MTAALIALLAWSVFAFGAVYDWAYAPLLVLSLVGAGVTMVGGRRQNRWLDLWLLAVVGVAVAQLVPLPHAWHAALSPGRDAYLNRALLIPPPPDVWRPISLYPTTWLLGAGLCVGGVATFIWARDALLARNVRRVARAIAWIGLILSAYALVQPSLFPNGLIYGFWEPIARGMRTAGPIVSRNHFAAWVILAWPLTVGYLIAHGRTHWQDRRTHRGVLVLSDTRALWLLLSAAVMIAALLWTESRSGVIGLAVAGGVLLLASWTSMGGLGRVGLLAFLALVAVSVSFWASPDAVLYRFSNAWSGVDGGRPDIWAQTMTIVRAFPVTGIGLGTFDIVMPAYQTSSFASLLNHAHNQYLHLLAEGGLLLTVPMTGALFAFIGVAWRGLRRDRTPLVHVRHGAMAGLVGLAVQCVVEVPLLTPAVVLLAAVCAALVARGVDVEPRD